MMPDGKSPAISTCAPITDKELLTRLSQCGDLPSPVGVVMRILELGQDPEVSLGEVAKVINLDPALTTKLLRMANSPLYARKRKTENLRQAITLFGLEGTITLALGFSVVNKINNPRSSDFDYPHFWRRSLAAATCSQVIAERLALPYREDMFLAGLLQDIGMMALDRVMPELYQGMVQDSVSHDRVQTRERERLGVDHAAIGAWLLQQWNFPESLQTLVRHSHDPWSVDISCQPALDLQAKIIAISSEIADLWCNIDKDALLPALLKKSENLLGIKNEAFVSILESATAAIAEIAQLFEIELDEHNSPESIVNQARELILLRHIKVMQKSMMLEKAAKVLENRTVKLEEENRRDVLTGLFNRSYLQRALFDELEMSNENGWPFAVMFIDLDRFKEINDEHGHLAGDQIIKSSARILKQYTRGSDIVARYGGEEFVVILPGAGQHSARGGCDRLLNAFRTMRHNINETTDVIVTASFGVAVHGEHLNFECIEDMLKAADSALYEAKRRGRDRYVFHEGGAGVSLAAG